MISSDEKEFANQLSLIATDAQTMAEMTRCGDAHAFSDNDLDILQSRLNIAREALGNLKNPPLLHVVEG